MTTTPGQILADNNANFVVGDQYGLWIADNNTDGPLVLRYALDSGRWITVPLANSGVALSNNRCMVSNPVNNALYVLQYDTGTSTTLLTVIDTNPSGTTASGVTAINGITATLTITDQLGGSLSTPAGLVFDPQTGTLWTATGANANNTEGFYRIDPSTGLTTFFDVGAQISTPGFGPYDIFASGGFLYYATNSSQGTVSQFDSTTVTFTGSQQIFDGGFNSGQVTSFDVDPTTGNVVCVPVGGDTTLFSSINGYLVFAPSSMAVVGVGTLSGNKSARFDASGNIWQFTWNGSPNQILGTLTKSNTPPTNFGQNNVYGAAWAKHINGNPNLFMVDDGTGGGVQGALYAGNDADSGPLFILSNTANVPNPAHITPGALVTDNNSNYPSDDQFGLWISSNTKVARYSPIRGESAFFIVPLPDSVIIPPNGIALDSDNLRLYVLDQVSSYIWVIDTTPVVDVSSNLVGVNGILRYLDLTSQWPTASATFGGLALDTVTTGDLFIADGSSNSYRVTTSGSITIGMLDNSGVAVYAAGGAILYPLSAFVSVYGADLVDPSSQVVITNYPVNQVAVGVSSNGTSYFVADQAGYVDVLAVDGSSYISFTPEGTYFQGGTIQLQGVAAESDDSTVWVALTDSTASINYIINFASDGSSVNAVKVLPAPFVFPGAGNYGQGSYGYAWLGAPISEVFVSDNTNNELWSGDYSSNPMVVETTFPYVPIAINLGAEVNADSSVTSDLTLPPKLVASGDSDVEANLSGGTAQRQPVWMAYNQNLKIIYVLDLGTQVIWAFDKTQPSGTASFASFDVSSIPFLLPRIEVDATYSRNLYLSDGNQTVYTIDYGLTTLTSYNLSGSLSGTILDFVLNAAVGNLFVSDSGGNLTVYQGSNLTLLHNNPGGPVFTKMNATWAGDVAAFKSNGVTNLNLYGEAASANFTLETDPTQYSITFDDNGDAYLVAIKDVNGSDQDLISVWDQNPLQEHYTLSWPGSGFAGFLVPYTSNSFDYHGYVFGLDNTGNLYQLDGGLPAGEGYYTPPDWEPAYAATFPELCVQILPDGPVFETGTYIWALGEENGLYRYNVSTGLYDLFYPYTPSLVAIVVADASLGAFMTYQGALGTNVLADSSITADLEVVMFTSSVLADSSITASAQVNAATTTASIVADSSVIADVSVNYLIPTDLLADSHLYVQLNVFGRATAQRAEAPELDRSNHPPMVRHVLRIKKEST